MPTRRSLLKRSAETATLAGLASLAGCLGSLTGSSGGGDGSDGPEYATAMFAPSASLDAANTGFFSYDLGKVYEMRDRFPDRTVQQFDAVAAQVEGVDPASVDRLSGVFGASLGGDPIELEKGIGGVSATGSFEPEPMADQLEATGVVGEGESYSDYTLYTVESDSLAAMGDDGDDVSAAVALGSDAVYAGMTTGIAEGGKRPVELMIDVANDVPISYYEDNETGRRLMDELSGSLTVSGMEVRPGLVERLVAGTKNEVPRTLSGLRAAGTGASIDGDTATSEMVLLYADGEAPARERVTNLVDRAKQREQVTAQFDDVSVERTDASVTLTATQPLETLFDPPLGPGGALGSGDA